MTPEKHKRRFPRFLSSREERNRTLCVFANRPPLLLRGSSRHSREGLPLRLGDRIFQLLPAAVPNPPRDIRPSSALARTAPRERCSNGSRCAQVSLPPWHLRWLSRRTSEIAGAINQRQRRRRCDHSGGDMRVPIIFLPGSSASKRRLRR